MHLSETTHVRGPATSAGQSALRKHLKEYSAVALAISGGADSMVLALLVAEYQQQHPDFQFTGLTVDHGLRPASKHEAHTVHRWFQQRGGRHQTLTVDVPKIGNKAANARQARYQAMAEWCKGQGIKTLLTAHHQLDQAETLCLRLQRGSGVQGLGGMAASSQHQGITLLRPLLDVHPQALRDYLVQHGQPWFEDASNRQQADRIKWRETLAEHPLITQRLAQTCTNMQRASAAIQYYVDVFINEYVKDGAFPVAPWHALPEEVRLRVLSQILQTASGQPYPPRLHSLERLAAAIPNPASHWPQTLHHCLVVVKQGSVCIQKEPIK